MGHFAFFKDIIGEKLFTRLKEVLHLTDEHFTYVARKYADTIFRIAYNYCKNRDDSDDIVQNVLLKYYKSNKDFESEEHIKHWLIRVAVNESKKLVISPFKRNIVSIDEIGDIPFEQKEESDLYYAVMKLKTKYRMIVYMYYYEDFSVNEIADILKENPSTVRTRLMRARKKLKENLEEVWTDE